MVGRFGTAAALALAGLLSALDREARAAWRSEAAEGLLNGDCKGVIASERPAAPDSQQTTPMHVVYGADAHVAEGLFLSLASLSRHLRRSDTCTVHIVAPEADVPRLRRMAQCARGSAIPRAFIHTLAPLPFDVQQHKASYDAYGGSAALVPHSFSRFFLQDLLPAAARALWLDTDTVVLQDVGGLFELGMRHAVAAGPDRARTHRRQYVAEREDLFNAGVLLLDLNRWRRAELSASLARTMQADVEFMTQNLALNLVFQGAFDRLDWRWNVLANGMLEEEGWRCVREARILHYNARPKYWEEAARPCLRDPGGGGCLQDYMAAEVHELLAALVAKMAGPTPTLGTCSSERL